jgi:hypothetical protein
MDLTVSETLVFVCSLLGLLSFSIPHTPICIEIFTVIEITKGMNSQYL